MTFNLAETDKISVNTGSRMILDMSIKWRRYAHRFRGVQWMHERLHAFCLHFVLRSCMILCLLGRFSAPGIYSQTEYVNRNRLFRMCLENSNRMKKYSSLHFFAVSMLAGNYLEKLWETLWQIAQRMHGNESCTLRPHWRFFFGKTLSRNRKLLKSS